MCGITGILDPNRTIPHLAQVINQFTEMLAHRGPDYQQSVLEVNDTVALGHRRLAIQDLSHDGVQPMESAGGRYITVFNGEIYNFLELRQELESEGVSFRGNSDTEVLLNSIEQYGLTEAISKWEGMFAVALLDRKLYKLHLIRDRLGKKPLYVYCRNNVAAFSSELRALFKVPGIGSSVDPKALDAYFRLGYVPAPLSIVQNVSKVMPGEILTLEFSDGLIATKQQTYWSVNEAYRRARSQPISDVNEATEMLRHTLADSTRKRMIADVPWGAFLSGGIDSSLVVALMQQQVSQPVKTFCVKFGEQKFDESGYAREVANFLGTEHEEIELSPTAAMEAVPGVASLYDEPFGDSSQIPTLLLCQTARQLVTVALSGDGGDEAFLGYQRYAFCNQVWNKINRMPLLMRQAAAATASNMPTGLLGLMASPFVRDLPEFGRNSLGVKVKRGADMLKAKDVNQLYQHLMCKYRTSLLVDPSHDSASFVDNKLTALGLDEYITDMGLVDTQSYLPDDILVKVDRASMAYGLEVRAPLLDHKVFELSWRMPQTFKHDGVSGKLILKDLAYSLVPKDLLDRPKMGFGVPLGEWLRGPLRGWAEDLLFDGSLRTEGLIDIQRVSKLWEEHQEGGADWHAHIWLVLMYAGWRQSVADYT